MKHNAHTLIKGDLRVRGQVRGGLHVEDVVTAEAFYLKTGGEVGGGGISLTVREADNDPTVANVNTIVVTDGTLTDDGGGQVTLAGGGNPRFNTVTSEGFYVEAGGEIGPEQWLLPDGTQALPSLGFVSQPTMGMYKEASDQLTFVIDNVEFLSLDQTANAIKMNRATVIPDGSPTAPSLRFNSDASTSQSGLYKPGTGEIAIGADETEAMHFSKAGVRTPHKFKAENFYLGRGGDLSDDFLTFQIESLAQKNYILDVSAPYDYEISEVVLRSESGTGVASFYVDPVGGTGAGRYGRPIEGLTDFYITQHKQTFTITPFIIGQGDEWFMGVESFDSARDVVGTVKIRR